MLYKFWRIFPGIFLEDFSGHFFPTKMRKNPARKSAKKSGGPKIKIREKSVLPKADPNNVWPLWCACSFSGCELACCHGTLLCVLSTPKCGGVLEGNDQNRAEKQNVVLTWFRPVTWSSGHPGRRVRLGVIIQGPSRGRNKLLLGHFKPL